MLRGVQPQDVFPGRGRWAPAFFCGAPGEPCLLPLVFVLLGLMAVSEHAAASQTLLKVPFHRQTSYECGPASLASVLNFWGDPITPESIAKAIFSSGARGTLTLDLFMFARRAGYETRQGAVDLESVQTEILSGRPVLLLVDEGFWIVRQGHFLVVTGFDEQGLFVHDGREKNAFIPYSRLMKKWERTGRWGMFLKPGGPR